MKFVIAQSRVNMQMSVPPDLCFRAVHLVIVHDISGERHIAVQQHRVRGFPRDFADKPFSNPGVRGGFISRVREAHVAVSNKCGGRVQLTIRHTKGWSRLAQQIAGRQIRRMILRPDVRSKQSRNR